ncbi:hypothetical protein MNBD_BACTEROID03-1632 [hydrothermal vent metagenome]|uniref:Uncharacterized protein n=1 Tax=hydrothermal vent metagenome TaxID=652676 RepID=A0A3B0TGY0_9ZZZZ
MKAIKSFGNYPITGTAKVGETVFGGQEEGVRGRKNGTKKLVVAGIEKKKKGVPRLYARQISRADAASLGGYERPYLHRRKRYHEPMYGLRAIGEGFRQPGTDPFGQKGKQLPRTAQGDNEPQGAAQGNAPPCTAPTRPS